MNKHLFSEEALVYQPARHAKTNPKQIELEREAYAAKNLRLKARRDQKKK